MSELRSINEPHQPIHDVTLTPQSLNEPQDTPDVQTLIDLDPNPIEYASGTTTLICHGTGFKATSEVWVNGNPYPTTFISPTRLELRNMGVRPTVGVWPVLVRAPDTRDSNMVDWVFEDNPDIPNPEATHHEEDAP